MVLRELFRKGINTTLYALEPYYVNYNALQQITSLCKVEPQTQFKQAYEIQETPPYHTPESSNHRTESEGNR